MADRSKLLRCSAGFLALAALFLLYAHFRQRYVGACDWYGYYAEARLFLDGRLHMPIDIDLERYPAAVPLSYSAFEGEAVPMYPPGFPILLAAGMLAGAEFYVTPLCAVLSVWLMYVALARRTNRLTAILFSALWAFFPIVVWGARAVMSDLPAALALLACLVLLDRDRPAAAGVIFAFAVTVRPTNALFGLLLLPIFGSWRRLVRFGVTAAAGGMLYGLYNWHLFGAPWRTGYSLYPFSFRPEVFPGHFTYYGRRILADFTPLLILPALWTAARQRPRGLVLLVWFLLLWVLYSFWGSGGDEWTWMRFLLPGFPALFLLAGEGWEDLRSRLERLRPKRAIAIRIGMVLTAAGLLANFLRLDVQLGHHQNNEAGKPFHDVAMWARREFPPGTLVGSFEASGALRLYGGFDTCLIPRKNCVRLLRDRLSEGRPVTVLLEPGLRESKAMKSMLDRFETGRRIRTNVDGWGKTVAVELLGPKRRRPP